MWLLGQEKNRWYL